MKLASITATATLYGDTILREADQGGSIPHSLDRMRQAPGATVRQIAARVVLVVSLTGCGGEGGSDDASRRPSRSNPTVLLIETCSKVEAAMRQVGGDWFPVPTQKQAHEFLVKLDGLAKRGTRESQDALTLSSDPIRRLVVDYPAPGQEMVNASKRVDGGIGALADRCKAAGEPIRVRGAKRP